MIFLVLGVALLLAWMWTRSEVIRRGGWRVGAGLFALFLVVVGSVVTIKGEWWVGLPLVGVALLLAAGGRINRRPGPAAGASARPAPQGMSAAEARSILGVEAEASPADIRTAYKRLMQRAHPDKGGTAGLAAQLNAARDRLLKGYGRGS
jgi:hypothetical protein